MTDTFATPEDQSRTPSTRSRRGVLAALTAVGVSGCLGGEAIGSSDETPTETPEASPVPAATSQGMTLKELYRPPKPTSNAADGPGLKPPFPETTAEIADYRKTLITEGFERAGQSRDGADPIRISSLQELQEYALRGNVHVKMEPGVYEVTEDNFGDLVRQWLWATRGEYMKSDDGQEYWMFVFARGNSYYDLRDVTIRFDAKAFDDVPATHGNGLFRVDANNTVIRGLTIDTVNKRTGGDSKPWGVPGWMYYRIAADNVLTWDISITTGGSTPYGVGKLLGKGSGNRIVGSLNKAHGYEIFGKNNYFIDSTIDANHFGHIMTIFGHSVWINCDFEGELRTTDDILQDPNNAAAAVNYIEHADDEKIQPGRMVALTEDTFRTYGSYTATKILGCRVEKSRGGQSLVSAQSGNSECFISNSTFVDNSGGIQPHSNTTLHNVRMNIKYNPLLILRDRVSNVTGDITILPSPTEQASNGEYYGGGPGAYIAGKNHDLTFRQSEPDLKLKGGPRPIWIGAFGGNQYQFAKNVSLENKTELPVVLREGSENCDVVSRGPVEDRGTENSVTMLADSGSGEATPFEDG